MAAAHAALRFSFHTFSIRWHRRIPHTWGPTAGVEETEETKAASEQAYFPAPSSFISLFSMLHALWGSAPLHRWSFHPVQPGVLLPSRCWPLVMSFHLSPLIPSLPVNSLQLFLCPAQTFPRVSGLSHPFVFPARGRPGWGRAGLCHHSFIPFVFKIFVFYFLR